MARKEKLNKITQIANNEEAAVALFNENVDKVNRAIEDSLSISGKDPNVMRAPLDMGEQPIINSKMRNIADRMDGDVVLWGEVKDFESATNRAETAAKEAEAWKNETQDIAKTLEDKLRDELAANYVKNNTKVSGSLAMGEGSSTSLKSDVVIGKDAKDLSTQAGGVGQSVIIGDQASTTTTGVRSVAVGSVAKSGFLGTAIGPSTRAIGSNSVALGFGAAATVDGSIQIGNGINSEEESLYVYLGTQRDITGDGVAEWVGNNYKLLGKDGKIPADRIPQLSYATPTELQNSLQNVREDFMDSDNDLQIQINGQAAALEEVKDDCMANLSEIADLKTNKQDKLVAGSNIILEGNVISAIGSGGDIDLAGYTKNIATGSGSFSLNTAFSYVNATSYGVNSKVTGGGAVAIGNNASSKGNGVAIGQGAYAGENNVVIGMGSSSTGNNNILIGQNRAVASTLSAANVAIGNGTEALKYMDSACVLIGHEACTSRSNIAFGTAIGYQAVCGGNYAIQLGRGTNNTANTMSVGLSESLNVQLLDANGNIPDARILRPLNNLAKDGSIVVVEGGEKYSVVGSVSINANKVASGFASRNSYLKATNPIFTSTSGHSGFEMVIAFETSSSSASGSLLTVDRSKGSAYIDLGLRMYQGKISAFCGSNSRSIQASETLPTNTKVYAKLKYDVASGYVLQYSTDGSSWTTKATLENTSIASTLSDEMYIGLTSTSALKVYLEDTYVTVDGAEVWRASKVSSISVKEKPAIFTNCITEIPQNIKLELNDGTLTLKAGSKVYVPYGSGVFNTITTTADVSGTRTDSQECVVLYYSDGRLGIFPKTLVYSGETAPTGIGTFAFWYDTTENKCKITNDNGSTWASGVSFPICVIETDGTKISAIKQVFNGFGYVGSTVFALPGVKGLIPNGRNADGSLKNIEISLTKVLTRTNVGTNVTDYKIGIHENTAFFNYDSNYNYDDENNLIKINTGIVRNDLVFAAYSTDGSNRITSFNSKNPFQAVDYNDAVKYSDFATTKATTASTASKTKPAVVVENYKKGDNWYRVWSDGWIEQGGVAETGVKNTITFLKPFSDTNYTANLTSIGDSGFLYAVAVERTSATQMTIHAYSGAEDRTRVWVARGY